MPPPLRLVLDTNTVLALWLFDDPALKPLATLIATAGPTLHSRGDALEELRRVLAYAQFCVAPELQATILGAYRAQVTLAPPPAETAAPLPICRDRDDQKFLEIARDVSATHLLTRDKALLKLARHRLVRDRFQILPPERFVAAMPPDSAARQ